MKATSCVSVLGIFMIIQSAFGQQVGGPVNHDLKCSPPASASGEILLGVGYRLECKTQALAPQYNLRGCSLFSRVVRPNAPENEIDLELVRQTSRRATLVNKNLDIKVVVKKSNLSATVYFGNSARSTCEEL